MIYEVEVCSAFYRFHPYRPRPRPVKLTEENPLPGSKYKSSVVYYKRERMPCKTRRNMSVRVSFGVPVMRTFGHKRFKSCHYIRSYRRICVFVHSKTAGRMRYENHAYPAFDVGTGNRIKNLTGNVDKFFSVLRTDLKIFHCINPDSGKTRRNPEKCCKRLLCW